MKLFDHQSEALVRARNDNLALFHDCGTGKTCTALEIIKHWKAKGQGPALVVCPVSIIETAWLEDCKKFTPKLSIVSLWARDPHTRTKRLRQDHDIYVTNYETFKSLYAAICKKGFKVLIVDESSKMKNPKSQITQALLSLAGIPFRRSKYKTSTVIPHRYVLSGTPAPNDQSEYWAQIKMITGPGNKCFHDNYYVFRSKYFAGIPLGLTGQKMYKFRGSMQDEFMDAMQPITHIVSKADALDLPEQTHLVRKVYLSPAERRAYETMKNDLVLRFKDEMILSQTALTEIMKLRQLTSGFIYGDEGTYLTGQNKIKELSSLLEEIGNNQVIIWANFKYEIIQLLKKLNKKLNLDPFGPDCQALWSGTFDKDETIKNFKNGDTKYLIANPASAAHGLTFTNCRYAIYFSLNYSYELQKQSQDRIHRIGQKHSTTYYYLVADKTVDEMIYKVLQHKDDLSKSILNYLKAEKKKAKVAV